jgi:hypothetical protein
VRALLRISLERSGKLMGLTKPDGATLRVPLLRWCATSNSTSRRGLPEQSVQAEAQQLSNGDGLLIHWPKSAAHRSVEAEPRFPAEQRVLPKSSTAGAPGEMLD